MTTPYERAVGDAINRLDTLRRRPQGKNPPPPPLDQFRRRLPSALARATTARNRRDGWPTSTEAGGGTGAGPTITVTDEHGQDVKIPATGVEAIALDGGPRDHPDPVSRHTHAAARHFVAGVAELEKAAAELDKLDALADEAPVDVPACESCARALEHPRPPAHYGDLGGRLAIPMHLCAPCHQYVDRTGYLPTVEQLGWHRDTGRWRIRGGTKTENGARSA